MIGIKGTLDNNAYCFFGGVTPTGAAMTWVSGLISFQL